MPLFILVMLGLMVALNLLWAWRADRLLRPAPRAGVWRAASAGFVLGMLGLLGYVFVGGRLLGRTDGGLPTPLFAVMFVWNLFVLPVLLIALLGEGVVRGVATIVRRTRAALRPAPATVSQPAAVAPVLPLESTSPTLSRRALIGAALAAAPPLLAVAGTARGLSQLDEFRVRRITVPLADLPAALDGLTIAHVTDVHVGDLTRGRTLGAIAAATNALRADLVLMTGDLLNRRLSDLPAALDMVRRIDPRHGLYMCEGNHDLFEGRRAFADGVRARGVNLLVNQAATVRVNGHPVQLLGLRWGGGGGASHDDPRARPRSSDDAIRESMTELLAGRDRGAFPILLAHHPHAFDAAAAEQIPLTLAGHTHGGQLMAAPGLGFGPWMYRYWSGLYRTPDARAACVVSNGVGNWFPLRINAPAEIVHVTLRRG